MVKKISSLILSLAFILSYAVIPFASNAAGAVSLNDRTYYDDLTSAFEAADSNDEIKVVSDVTVSKRITVSKKITLTVADGAAVKVSSDVSSSPFSIAQGGTLEISGSFDGSSLSGGAFFDVSGTLTLRGASISGSRGGAIRLNRGICELYGASISGNGSRAIYVSSDASGVRMSGNISLGPSDRIYLANGKVIDIMGAIQGGGTINVATDADAEGTQLAVIANSSISVSASQIERFRNITPASTREAKLEGSNIVAGKTVKNETRIAAKIGGTEYETLSAAFASVRAGEKQTIILLSDAFVSTSIPVSDGRKITLISQGANAVKRADSLSGAYIFNVSSGSSLEIGTSGDPITISGAGVSSSMPAIYCGGNVTLGSAASVSDNNNTNTSTFNQGTIFVPEGGTLTLSGGKITTNKAKAGGAALVYGGTFNFVSGTISGNSADNGGGVYIHSGTFAMSGGIMSANGATANGGAVYCGGTFRLSGKASIPDGAKGENDVFLTTGKTISVTSGWAPASGTVAVTPTDSELNTKIAVYSTNQNVDAEKFTLTGEFAELFKPRAADNYVYLGPITDDAVVAVIGNDQFMSLSEAIEKIPSDGKPVTVTVVNEIKLLSSVVIPSGKNVVLNVGALPEDKTVYTFRSISRDPNFDQAFFVVQTNATLSLKGENGKSLVLDGSAVPAANSLVVVNGVLNIGDGAILHGNSVNKTENLADANVPLSIGGAVIVEATGTANMTGGTIESNYAGRGGAVYIQDGTFNMSGGTIGGNTALYGGGVYINNNSTADNVNNEKAERHGIFNMTGGTVTKNTAKKDDKLKTEHSFGGGIYVANAAVFTMSGGTVSANKAEKGSGVCVGTLRAKDEPAVKVPIFEISAAASVAQDNNVYLNLINESVVKVVGELTAIKSSAPLMISIPSILAQNSSLVDYEIANADEKRNSDVAAAAVSGSVFKLADDAAALYKISASPADASLLINTAGDANYLRYKPGREYNGLSDVEKIPSKDPDAAETTVPVEYIPFNLPSDGCFTFSFETSYYFNLFKDIRSEFVGALPSGTKLTLIDYSDESKPRFYCYETTGEEDVLQPDTANTAPAGDKNPANTPKTVIVPFANFISMTDGSVHFGDASNGEKPSTDRNALKHERFTVVVDFSHSPLAGGEYDVRVVHACAGQTEGREIDIAENFGSAHFTVGEDADSTVKLEVEKDALKLTYKLGAASRSVMMNGGLAQIEIAHGKFPQGTAVECGGVIYPVPSGSSEVSIPLPKNDEGELILENTVRVTMFNYYGTALLDATVRAALYPSFDGTHIAAGIDNDVASDGVAFTMSAAEVWAVSVLDTAGIKPVFEFEDVANAGNLIMNIQAKRNGESVASVLLTLEDASEDYETIPLSTLFVGFDDNDSSGAKIFCGSLAMKFKSNVNNGEYRLKFTAGDKSEYIKIKIGN